MTLWQTCQGEQHIKPLEVEPWRVVEAQHVLSTRDLVDSAAEHDQLEALLEASKPKAQTNFDYLIFTPFRYPPLNYGSRFGRMIEPSLWYGSMELPTALAEVAYYRLLFLKDTTAALGYIDVLLTAFKAWLKTPYGVDLTKPPFVQHKEALCAKDSYDVTQALGSAMRQANVDVFIFHSARSPQEGRNIGVFRPTVFYNKNAKPTFDHQTWQCMADVSSVEFTRSDVHGIERYVFNTELFF